MLLVDPDIALVVVGRALWWLELDIGEVFTILQKCGGGDGGAGPPDGPLGVSGNCLYCSLSIEEGVQSSIQGLRKQRVEEVGSAMFIQM